MIQVWVRDSDFPLTDWLTEEDGASGLPEVCILKFVHHGSTKSASKKDQLWMALK